MGKAKKWARPRHTVVQAIASLPVGIYLKHSQNFVAEKIKGLPKGPLLVIANHVTTFDPFYVALSIGFPAYYVLSDDIVSKKGLGPLLKFLVNPIPKTKSIADYHCVRTIMRVLKEGERVVLFPEGNRTYDSSLCTIDDALGKLVKVIKNPVVILNIVGGYGADPRWGRGTRRGKVTCRLRKILYPEDIEKYSAEVLNDYIIQNLQVDELKNCYPPYHSNRSAEYLERCVFTCPDCGTVQTIRSEKNEVYCTRCGYHLHYNEDLTFTLVQGNKKICNVKEWCDIDRKWMEELKLSSINNPIFVDNNVTLFHVIKMVKRVRIVNNGTLTAYSDRFVFEKGKKHRFEIKYEELRTACVVGKHKGNFFLGDTILQAKGDERFNAFKYVMLVKHFQNLKKDESGPGEFLGI